MAVEISLSNGQLTEGRSSYQYMTFTVTLSAPAPSGGVSMSVRNRPGTALEDVDYDSSYGFDSTLNIAAGVTSATIRVAVYGDTADETDESFIVELSDPRGAVFADDAPVLRASGMILDDDGLGSNLALVVSDPILVEGASGAKLAHVEAFLSRVSSTPVSIPYQTVNGTAVAGEDYTATSGTLTFLAGQTAAAVDVPVAGDATPETAENFSLVFAPPDSVASGAIGAAGLVTILDDDAGGGAVPTISISNGQLIEGRSSYEYMTFTVTLSAPAPSGGVSMNVRNRPGTALENVDYDSSYGFDSTLNIAAGATSATIRVAVYGDTDDETDESFIVELSNPRGAVFAGNAPTLQGSGTILDDDGGADLAVSVINPTTLEGDNGTRVMHFEALLSRPQSALVVLPFQTIDGTAVSGQDYVATNGSLSFLPGQTSASVDVTVTGDYVVEGSETFSVLFSASSTGTATAAISATGTITNDDSRTTVNGTPGNDPFTDGPTNQLFVGGAGRDVLTLTDGRRGATFILSSNGDVEFVHRSQADTLRGVEEIRFIDGRMVFDLSDPAAQVARLYQAGLGRAPDQGGLNFWIDNIRAGVPLSDLATAFLSSPEFTSRFGTDLANQAFVSRIYQNVLGRDPDAGGLQFWTGQLDTAARSRGQVLADISESSENRSGTAALVSAGIWDRSETAQQVARLYDTALGRLPDAGGLGFWTGAIEGGTNTLLALAQSFVTSAEFSATYGALGNRAFVEKVYGNTLGRAGDAGGVDYWTSQLDGGVSRASVTIGFSESTEHRDRTAANTGGETTDTYGVRLA